MSRSRDQSDYDKTLYREDLLLGSFARVQKLFDLFMFDAVRCKAAALQKQNERQNQNQNLTKECYGPQQFPFMLLPPEIRDMIYGFLLPFHKNVTIQCYRTAPVYRQHYTPISMGIFKVSQQVRDEAYATFFRNNTIAIEYQVKSHVMLMKQALMTLGYQHVRRIYLQHYSDIRAADQQYSENERKFFALTSMVVNCPNLRQIDINPCGQCWLLGAVTLQIQALLRDQLECIASKEFLEGIPISYPNIHLRAGIAGVPLLLPGKGNLRLLEAMENSLGLLKRWMKGFEMTSINSYAEFMEYKIRKRLANVTIQ